MSTVHHGAFLILPFNDNYILFRRTDSGLCNLVGGGMDFPEVPSETVVRETNEEIELVITYPNISVAGIMVQRIPPIKDNLFGFCFIYEPTNPLYLYSYGHTFEEITKKMKIDHKEATEIVLFSIDEIMKRSDITMATKRIMFRYNNYIKEGRKRVFEGFLRDPVHYEGLEI